MVDLTPWPPSLAGKGGWRGMHAVGKLCLTPLTGKGRWVVKPSPCHPLCRRDEPTSVAYIMRPWSVGVKDGYALHFDQGGVLKKAGYLEERHGGVVVTEVFAEELAEWLEGGDVSIAVTHVDVELNDISHGAAGFVDDGVEVVEHLAALGDEIGGRDDGAVAVAGILPG